MYLRSRPLPTDGAARLSALLGETDESPRPPTGPGGWTPEQGHLDDPFWPEPSWDEPGVSDDLQGSWSARRSSLPEVPEGPAEPAPVPVSGPGWVPAGPSNDPVPDGTGSRPVPSVLAVLRRGNVDLGRRGVLALVLVGAVAAAFAGFLLLRGRPSEQPVATAPVVVRGSVGASKAPTAAAPGVVIAVGGKVRHPGLVHLPAGSRVDDAVRAAGGTLPAADVGLLNLARVLVDGEQVLVGVAVPAAAGGPAALSGTAGSAGSAVGSLDLNAAAVGDLDSLPGIGPVLAQRIVDWRTEHGRFASVDQLREVSGIGEAKYQSLKPKVHV